ncbi:hypothetical protein FQR65_LT17162 [Abscondita terminalis]|nr:hypothetical protein FQR65_LT17162 [Abscondita terminalis]
MVALNRKIKDRKEKKFHELGTHPQSETHNDLEVVEHMTDDKILHCDEERDVGELHSYSASHSEENQVEIELNEKDRNFQVESVELEY